MSYRVIGLMSGTSLDGLDIAYCHFNEHHDGWNYEIKKAATIPYSKEWHQRLSDAYSGSGVELSKLDADWARYVGLCVVDFISQNGLHPQLIASHGQTIFHAPQAGYTTQLGSGAVIYAITGVPVVCDFRSEDVALGGQGAPLVPIGDKLLFSEYEYCLNLGGIANISMEVDNRRIAYDICPVNLVLNELSSRLGKLYDDGGSIAASGTIIHELFETLNELEFYALPYPKSLGKEWIEKDIVPLLHNTSTPDLLATFVEHIAYQIATKIPNNVSDEYEKKMLITGGGAFNSFLIRRLEHHVQSKAKIIVPDTLTINFKEALIFGFLGLLRGLNKPNCLASVTGASRDHCAGAVYGHLKI